MDISLLDRALWIAGFFGHAILLLVLIVRERWRTFPVFTALIGIVGTAGGLLAVGLVFAVNPGLPGSLSAWIEKANLLAIMLICELFVSMMLASTRLGLAWKNHVMGLSRGLTGWAIVALLVEAAHSYLGPNWHAAALDHARMFSYLGANAYWLVIFWQSEPQSRTLSDEMQRYLFELHRQVNVSLGSVSRTKHES
jgi:hypothetical protein